TAQQRFSGKPLECQVRLMSDVNQVLDANRYEVVDAGQRVLPHAALGFIGGGSFEVESKDESGRVAKRPQFNVRIFASDPERVDALTPDLRTHSDAALGELIRETRELFVRGRQDAQAVRRGFAIVREVARRETGEEAYLVQIMGAMALYHGRIVEMVTGEGK